MGWAGKLSSHAGFLDQEAGDGSGGGGFLELEEVAAPGSPEGSVVGDRAFDDVDHMLGAAGGEGADGGLLDEGDVAFLLAGDDVVHHKGNLGGDGFLNGRAAGFADEKVMRAHE